MNVELKRWKEKYIGELQTAADSPAVACWLADSFHSPFTEHDASEFVCARLYADPEQEYSRAVIVDGKVCGCIHMTLDSDIFARSADLYFWLSPEVQNRGVMTCALGFFVHEVFRKYSIARICARPFADNTAARCVLNNCGFELEGIMKMAAFKQNTFHDVCIYAVLNESR